MSLYLCIMQRMPRAPSATTVTVWLLQSHHFVCICGSFCHMICTSTLISLKKETSVWLLQSHYYVYFCDQNRMRFSFCLMFATLKQPGLQNALILGNFYFVFQYVNCIIASHIQHWWCKCSGAANWNEEAYADKFFSTCPKSIPYFANYWVAKMA